MDDGKGLGMSLSSLRQIMDKVSAIKDVLVVHSIKFQRWCDVLVPSITDNGKGFMTGDVLVVP